MRAIVYDEDGKIQRSMSGAVPLDKQNLADGESVLCSDECEIPADLHDKRVDTTTDPPRVVEDADYEELESPSVARDKISAETKESFRQARADGDVQTQLDVLFEILTGEEP